jgi:hypothetical protein
LPHLREEKVDGGGRSVSMEVSDEWAVGWSGEDGDDVEEVEERDSVAFGHEEKENHMVSLHFSVVTHSFSHSLCLAFYFGNRKLF